MKKIYESDKLIHYIEKYSIDDFFSNDMREFMELIYFEKGDHIVKDNEKINYFYFFVKGKIKVYTILKNGKSLLFRLYNPLQVIGDVEFIDYANANSNIQAITDSLCIAIPMNYIRKYALNDPIFLKCMCRSLGKKFINSTKVSSINILYPLENRLAIYLLAIEPEKNNNSNNAGIITDKFTEMADLLGTSYRHLVRIINNLCEKNIIKREKNSIIILNRVALEELAEDLYEQI